MSIKVHVQERLLIKELEDDINALKKEVNKLEMEKRLLDNELRRNQSNGVHKLARRPERYKQFETIINLDSSTLKRCLECCYINKKYPELYGYKYNCICTCINPSFDHVDNTKRITCICNVRKRTTILR